MIYGKKPYPIIFLVVLLFPTLAFSQELGEEPKGFKSIHQLESERYAKVVKTGLDVLFEKRRDLIRGRRVGIITNPTGVNREGVHMANLFLQEPDVALVAIFGPEHGILGRHAAGEHIGSGDKLSDVPVFSLYGKTLKPTPKMLEGLDVLIYDIQDVGARFYTYISTMSLAMEAAAEAGIEFMVLDRPNPIRGDRVDGPVLDPQFSSFVGIHPIPIQYGMTVGELALLFNGEGYLKDGVQANLVVVPMEGWRRGMWFDETGLPWVKPSPNIVSLKSATLYVGVGILESTVVSVGRGTGTPFEWIGAPWIDSGTILRETKALKLPGVRFKEVQFTPEPIPGMEPTPKFEGQSCSGVSFEIVDRDHFRPVRTAVHLICLLHRFYPEHFGWRSNWGIERTMGTDRFRLAIEGGKSPEEIIAGWQIELEEFKKVRKKYLLYE